MSDAREALVALILERFRAAETYMDLPRQARLLADAILALPPGRTETEVRAEAWDEGHRAGLREGNDQVRGITNNPALNPYREEARRG